MVRPLIAAATTSSARPSAYISAVSISVAPRSSPVCSARTSCARWRTSSPILKVPSPSAGKRGGTQSFLWLDLETEERRYRNEPRDDLTPERLYDRRWALAVLERALAGERVRVPVAEVEQGYEVPREVLAKLQELGVLSPDEGGYSPSDVKIIEAMRRFRAGGFEESIGFTVYDTLRYKQAMETLAAEEVKILTDRLAGMDPDRVLELIEGDLPSGAYRARELVGASA